MIARTARAVQPNTTAWQHALADSVRDVHELLALLDLPAETLDALAPAAKTFPLRVPRGFVARMRRGDPADPLLRQVLPLAAEHQTLPGYASDPVGDLAAVSAPGVLQKYYGRALLVLTGACPVHCRYCFRRHFPYTDMTPSREAWQAALAPLRRDSHIHELILSGGDPWSLSTARLAALSDALGEFPHLKRLRIHTRFPVVVPERVDDALIEWLSSVRQRTIVVVHVNHGNEIDHAVRQALTRLKAAGVTLLNQSVLLRGVNDDAEALIGLSERLFDAGVLPYYLHMLDRVAGAAHFEVDEPTALALLAEMRRRLPGYLVPRLVRERAGAEAKVPIA